MMKAVGVIELTSIARGIEVTDNMLKTSNIDLIESKSICPGKYLLIVAGNVSEVKSAMDLGLREAQPYYVDHVLIPNVSDQVVYALRGIPETTDFRALGIMEFFSTTGAIYAADAAVKTSDIKIVTMRLGYALGGKSYVVVTGDLSAIEAGIETGSQVGESRGLMFNMSVIASPERALLARLI